MRLVSISEIKDNVEFWRGTRFRHLNVGLNVSDKNLDYYEYMLVEVPGELDYMLLTCVEGHKSGAALAFVKTALDKSKFVVTAEAIKFSMGEKDIYLIQD
jgi:hypothetical protein